MNLVNGAEALPFLSRLYGAILTSPHLAGEAHRLFTEIGPRPAGSPAGEAAERFARETLSEAGCDRVEVERLPVPVWERGPLELRVVHPVARPIQALSLGLSRGSGGNSLEAGVMDVGRGLAGEFDCAGDRIDGAFALVEEGAPPGVRAPHRAVKTELAARAGAAGMLLMNGTGDGLPRTGTCTFTGEPSAIPAAGLSREDGLFLRRLLRAHGSRVRVRLSMENRYRRGAAQNVVGLLDGREQPEEYVYLAAHLDSWDVGEGALDNGTGVLALCEAARALARLPERPRRSVAFCLFTAEETGLNGSFHHVRLHDHRLDRITACLNLDIVGRPVKLATGGKEAAFPFLVEALPLLSPLGLDREIHTVPGLHSDHVPFMLEGVPTLSWRCVFPARTVEYCHSTADRFDKVDLPGLRLCTCATAALAFLLAEAPERPGRRLAPEETRIMLEEAGLREPLESEGAWPF